MRIPVTIFRSLLRICRKPLFARKSTQSSSCKILNCPIKFGPNFGPNFYEIFTTDFLNFRFKIWIKTLTSCLPSLNRYKTRASKSPWTAKLIRVVVCAVVTGWKRLQLRVIHHRTHWSQYICIKNHCASGYYLVGFWTGNQVTSAVPKFYRMFYFFTWTWICWKFQIIFLVTCEAKYFQNQIKSKGDMCSIDELTWRLYRSEWKFREPFLIWQNYVRVRSWALQNEKRIRVKRTSFLEENSSGCEGGLGSNNPSIHALCYFG